MRTHKASQKQSLAANSFVSRPFVVQPKSEENTVSPVTQGYASQMPDFAIFNPVGERSPMQPKLAIGAPGDHYEQEAEPTAKQVLARMNGATSAQSNPRHSEVLQTKPESRLLQRQQESNTPNQTGLPDDLKTGVENLSGYSLDNVRVHYNSPKPAQLQALAYAQGTDIYVAPGQEEHLPHEAWHVVQQIQGRVKPTMQMKGLQINDDQGLETEADVMGARTLNMGDREMLKPQAPSIISPIFPSYPPIQLVKYIKKLGTGHIRKENDDNYTPIWGEKEVTETEYITWMKTQSEKEKPKETPKVSKEEATATKILTTVSAPKEKGKSMTTTEKPAEMGIPRNYPLGFASEEEFRDATRPLAKAHRGSTIIVSGSSVTGKSFHTGKPFSKESDIDVGIVGSDEFDSGEIDERGFAYKGTHRGKEELAHKERIMKAIGRKSGLKFFKNMPQRKYLERIHTPEASDDED